MFGSIQQVELSEEDREMKAPQGTVRFPFQSAFENFTIDPITNWERSFNPQFYINCNVEDVEVENHVLGKVGSYGNQLGKVIRILDLLVARLPEKELLPKEKQALIEFRNLSRQVKLAVSDINGPSSQDGLVADDVERVIEELEALMQTNPEAHQMLVERLQKITSTNGDK